MSGFWEGLLVVASKSKPRPILRLDLWETSRKVLELEDVLKLLAAEFEQFKAAMQAENDKLRLQVEVLQAHETRRRHG